MRLTEILQPECVKVPLAATDKQGAIYELIDLLAARGLVGSGPDMRAATWQRECTRTTGIGHGVAIPHGKCGACGKLCMAVGRPAQPLDYGSIDGRPVDLIFLLASPMDQTGPHIQALASISRLLMDPTFRAAVKHTTNAAELYKLIAEQESKVAV